MTIFNSAYDTLAGAFYRDTEKIKTHVHAALIYGDLRQIKPGVFCVQHGERSGSIPVFNYPLVFKDISGIYGNDSPYTGSVVVFDGRTYISTVRDERNPAGLNIRDAPKFQAMVLHSAMALAWENGDVNVVRDVGSFPFAVFSWWLAETITKRFQLDGNSQVLLMILAGIWYQSNFVSYTRDEVPPNHKTEVVALITRELGLRVPDLADIVDKYPVIYQIEDFIQIVKEQINSPKLDILNASVFVSTVAGSWIGPFGREQIVVALEYPPQWVTLCAQAASDRGYKIAKLTAVAERNTFKKFTRGFGMAVGELSSYDLHK